MGKRILSTVLLWSIVGAVLWFFRTPGALVLITLISVLTLREFYVLMHGAGYDPFDKFGLVIGAAITPAQEKKFLGEGVVAVISKPFSQAEIFAVVHETLSAAGSKGGG